MKTIPTVYELRKQGLKVSVNHHRQFYRFDSRTGKKHSVIMTWAEKEETFSEYHVSATGGFTRVCIQDTEGNSFCDTSECSLFDHYNKKTGTKKAIARALAIRLLDSRSI